MTFFGGKLLIAKMILFQWLCNSIKNFIAKFCRRMDFEPLFRGENVKSSLFTPKRAPFTKFQFECGVHDLVIKKKKTINLLNFEKLEAVQVS